MSTADESTTSETGRLRLLWDALVFQLKLALDGTRDLLLIPVSIAATIWGILFGGDEPDRYFRRVLEWGRRSEIWINLFGHHAEGETADRLIEPFQQRVFDEVANNPQLRRASSELNRALDQIGTSLAPERKKTRPHPPEDTPRSAPDLDKSL